MTINISGEGDFRGANIASGQDIRQVSSMSLDDAAGEVAKVLEADGEYRGVAEELKSSDTPPERKRQLMQWAAELGVKLATAWIGAR